MTLPNQGGKEVTTLPENCGIIVEAAASVRLDRDQTQYSALAVVLEGVDDDDLRERAEAELAAKDAEIVRLNRLLDASMKLEQEHLKAYQDLKARMGRIRALAGEE